MTAADQVDRTVQALATVGLPTFDARPWPSKPLPRAEWWHLLRIASSDGLTGFLATAIDSGRVPVTSAQADEARDAHTAALHTCLLLEQHLLAVTEVLAGAGVDVRVLKGAAVAHLDYEDPSQRTFRDVDLLVRSDQFDAAVRALVAAGAARRYRELRPGFDERFGKGACVVAPSGLETDLHRTFVMGPYGLRVALGDLWSDGETFAVGGRSLDALGPDVRFLHACYHAALGDRIPRLGQLRDVAQMLIGPRARVDVPSVRSLAERWCGEAVVTRAMTLTWEALGLAEHPLAAWAAAYEPRRRERRNLAAYLDPGTGFAARSIMAVRAVPGWRAKAAFVRGLVLPADSYGTGRHASRRERWRAALAELRRLAGSRR